MKYFHFEKSMFPSSVIHRQYMREQICPGCGSVGRAVASHTQGSNPDIVEFLSEHLSTLSCIKNTKIKKKEAENGPLLKTLTTVTNQFLVKSLQSKSDFVCVFTF